MIEARTTAASLPLILEIAERGVITRPLFASVVVVGGPVTVENLVFQLSVNGATVWERLSANIPLNEIFVGMVVFGGKVESTFNIGTEVHQVLAAPELPHLELGEKILFSVSGTGSISGATIQFTFAADRSPARARVARRQALAGPPPLNS